jgi:hemoglobin-like flavoprotein
MTPEQRKIVHNSFRKTIQKREDFAEYFYACLFDIAPEMKPLFREDIEEQAHRFIGMVSLAVAGMKDHETVSPEFENLGRRHRGYQIRASHYEPFGRALIWSLGQVLEKDFTPEVRQAWTAWYELVAQIMAGAKPCAAAPAG